MHRYAFTLIEILIVIAIILIIATIGIGSFSASRRSLIVDLETDKFIAKLHQLRDAAKAKSRCFGLEFKTNYGISLLEASYKNPRDGCDEAQKTPFKIDEEIKIIEVQIDRKIHQSASVLFLPPLGQIEFTPTGDVAEISVGVLSGVSAAHKIVVNRTSGKIEHQK